MKSKATVFAVLTVVAALSRLFPHYPNFTAMGALSFYTAYSSKNIWQSLALMAGTMMATDLVLNNLFYPTGEFVLMYAGSLFTYLGFAAYTLTGYLSKSLKSAALGLIAGSLIFFAISNFGVWISTFSPYPKTGTGLLAAYTAAIPFFAPELLSSFLFSAIAGYAESRVKAAANA
ncbi:MAG TPA: hypothetical protein DIT65_02220 [Cryomorphaceae bacterium]|nr:hypothetical protein [Cryomorphaceae bacterium]|tara:strand:- start:109 stop:633 length:525 start_codon:yes stop_codon:yes gene_type:complete